MSLADHIVLGVVAAAVLAVPILVGAGWRMSPTGASRNERKPTRNLSRPSSLRDNGVHAPRSLHPGLGAVRVKSPDCRRHDHA
jgi:hypothetical protein